MKRAIKTEIQRKDQKGAKRSIEISFRVTPAEHDKILKLTSNPRTSIADFVRFQVIGRDALRKLPETAELIRISGELGKIGSNINQVAYYFNSAAKAERGRDLVADYAQQIGPTVQALLTSMAFEIEALKAELGKL